MFSLEFYETASGDSPPKDFIRGMSAKGKAKFLQIAGLLEENGPEVRVIVGNDSSRVLYFFMEGRRIVFTNGFQKKTQKTPRKEIETAIRYRADYLKRRKLDEGI